MKMANRNYAELQALNSFTSRYDYLKLDGVVGVQTFGIDRIFNQRFYNSAEWKRIRDFVIIRDNGCDLGIEGREIQGKIIIHHMNPITLSDIERKSDFLMNPNYLITTSYNTHNAIHYGNNELIKLPKERFPNDTCPWRL